MPDHIEQRRRTWYAVLKVPASLRSKLGQREFSRTLQTPDRRRALQLAPPIVAMWKATIRQAQGEGDAVQMEALRWRQAIAAERLTGDGERVEMIESLLVDKAYSIEEAGGATAAAQFADIAMGRHTPSDLYFDAWAASIGHLAQKTQDQMRKDVRLLIERFHTLESINPQDIRRWVEGMVSQGTSASSLKRMCSFWRSYWKYLVSVEAVPVHIEPLKAVVFPKKRRNPEDKRAHLAPVDVVHLWRTARQQGDTVLGDLIELGAYTGARIEELCSLELSNVKAGALCITDSKTEAGVREVPIHSAIAPLIQRLNESAVDKYLLPGLTFNMYGDRSNAIGKRFGRLKTRLGYSKAHVFHSLRKTLITLLENAGVSENLAADIVGHAKPRITYGLYSGGAFPAIMAAAIELVKYPTEE